MSQIGVLTSHQDVERGEDEVVFLDTKLAPVSVTIDLATYPTNFSQCNRRNLGEQGGNQPVSNACSERAATSSDLHGHNLTHVHPADRTEREGEDNRNQE